MEAPITLKYMSILEKQKKLIDKQAYLIEKKKIAINAYIKLLEGITNGEDSGSVTYFE